ncbi:hypothetical protein GCK32_002229 [Trichostrongylus colubriformis]|uniref:Uncharacterized protein n=1 Tax=Trichostrongylus colubriformis TaxID=6319 RepID=A0AAN8IW03_TRICO
MARITRSKVTTNGVTSPFSGANPVVNYSASEEHDYSKMSVGDLMTSIIERNKDPVIDKMLAMLGDKIPKEIAESVDKQKRMRVIVLAELDESEMTLPPSRRQRELEENVRDILDVLDVVCGSAEVFRMGRYEIKPSPG